MSNPLIVKENGLGRYQQDVLSGKHHLYADEPESLGGDDAGPAPFDFLLASLGSCTSITLRMYAERKGLPLSHIAVALQYDKVQKAGQEIPRIQRTISLTGDLSGEQRQRLLEIAGKCPMHRALSPAFLLECTLAE